MKNIRRKIRKDRLWKYIIIVYNAFLMFTAGFCLYHWAWQEDVVIPDDKAIGAVYMQAAGYWEPTEFKRNLMAEAIYIGNGYGGAKVFGQPYNVWKDIWQRYVEAGFKSLINHHVPSKLQDLWDMKSKQLFYE